MKSAKLRSYEPTKLLSYEVLEENLKIVFFKF